jgi:uncharacterized Zn finger protein
MSATPILSAGVSLFPGPAVHTTYKGKHYLVDCESCGGMHPYEFMGDCREEVNRYGSEQDYADRNGVSVNNLIVVPVEEAA